MKRIALLLLLTALFLSLPLAASAQALPDTVVLAFTRQPDSLFSDYAATATASYALQVVYNSLVAPDADGNIVGELAESWEVSEDQLTWTFKLREDVKWHDGEPFTAADVKFTYEYSADPAYTGSGFDATILGAEAKRSGEADSLEGVQVIDDYTVSITTTEPNALFLQTTAQRYIMPQHVLADVPVAEFGSSSQARQPIGTGPYRVVEWKQDESIEYEAFDDFFGGRARISKYIWRIIPDASVQITELLNGNIDIMPEVPADDFATLEGEENVTTLRLPGVNMVTIVVNTTTPFFADKRVRQAVSYAIDRQSIVDVVGGGLGTDVRSQVHPSLPEYNVDLPGYPRDVERAKALLAEVGWTDEDGDGIVEAHGVEGLDDGTPFSIEFGTLGQPLYNLPAQVIQQNLRDVGIEINLNVVDFNIYFSEYLTTENPDFVIGMSGWFNLLFPPQSELAGNYASYGSGSYRAGWSSEEVDELLRQAPTVFDAAERNAIYNRVQEILHDELPWIYLVRLDNLAAYNANLVVPEVKNLNQLFGSVQDWTWSE